MLCAKLSVLVEVVDPALFRRRASDLLMLWKGSGGFGERRGLEGD